LDENSSYRNHCEVPNPSNYRQVPLLVALGSAVRSVRLQKGYSQEQLAHRAEVDVSYLGRVERGDNNVAVMTLSKIASALDLSMAQLMSLAEL
jgi:transcriptional regulator with XRE-family HTH domain